MAWTSRLGMRWSSQLSSINAQENVVPATYAESGMIRVVRFWILNMVNFIKVETNSPVRALNQWRLLVLTVWWTDWRASLLTMPVLHAWSSWGSRVVLTIQRYSHLVQSKVSFLHNVLILKCEKILGSLCIFTWGRSVLTHVQIVEVCFRSQFL